MNTNVLFSSGKDNWETPDELFSQQNAIYRFILDAAADSTNHKCDRWFGPGGEVEDALSVRWPLTIGNIWLNPPYRRGLQRVFIEKAIEEAHLAKVEFVEGRHSLLDYPGVIVCLLPARTDTQLFHRIIRPKARWTEFIEGRLKFKGAPSSAPFPSMLVAF